MTYRARCATSRSPSSCRTRSTPRAACGWTASPTPAQAARLARRDRLPSAARRLPAGSWPPPDELSDLRARCAASSQRRSTTPVAMPRQLAAINAASARAPRPRCRALRRRERSRSHRSSTARRCAEVVLAAFARDAIDAPHRPAARRAARLRAPGCVLLFVARPPAPRVVLERVRQPCAPGAPLPARAERLRP